MNFLLRKLRALVRRSALDREMDAELRFHVEEQTRRNVAAGMSPDEAALAARKRFGWRERIRLEARDARGFGWLEDLAHDTRHALRTLRKSPGFTTVAILSLALGIGANTAIFTVIDAVLLEWLPVVDPASLVSLTHQGKNGPPERPAQFANYPLYEFMRDENRSFSGVFAFAPAHLRIGRDANAESVSAQWVSPDYFSVLGVKPELGRTWSPEDTAAPAVVVISHRFWMTHFGADPDVVGRPLLINNRSATVIGVAPQAFLGLIPGKPIDVTLLLAAQTEFQPALGNLLTLGGDPNGEPMPTWELYVMGRVKSGVSIAQAESETTVLFRRWAIHRQASDSAIADSFYRAELTPGGKGLDALRRRFAEPLWALAAVVGGVFLIACANIANLLLARGASRRREIAVRAAIGASRGRLVRQLLTESLTLTLLGGAVGLLAAWWGSAFLVDLLASGRTPVELQVHPDARVLGFTIVVSVLAGFGVGLVPALRASSASSSPALNESGPPGHARTGRWSLGQTLVAAQLAISLCLIVGTGLFAENLRQIAAIDPGFEKTNLLSVSFDWSAAGFSKAQMMDFAQRAVERAKQVPGVHASSATFIEPLGRQASQRWFSVRGSETGSANANTGVVELNVVSEDYFATMNLPLVRGRDFDSRDSATAPKVAIISETLARSYFGDVDPVGQLAWIARDTTGTPFTIVGVAHDAKERDIRETPMQLLYLPITQSAAWDMNLLVRSAGKPTAIVPQLRRALAGLSPLISVREITTPQEQMERSLLQERLLANLTGFFGPLALLLAAVGLYGLLAYDVTRRTREIGVRMALGAQRTDVLRLVLKQGVLLVAVGTVTGLAGASALSGVIRGFLFAISPGDPTTLLAATVVLALVALLACWLPARRAAKVDPMIALRAE